MFGNTWVVEAERSSSGSREAFSLKLEHDIHTQTCAPSQPLGGNVHNLEFL